MKIINNLNSLNFKTKKNVDYSFDNFFKLDLFNPITDKYNFCTYLQTLTASSWTKKIRKCTF